MVRRLLPVLAVFGLVVAASALFPSPAAADCLCTGRCYDDPSCYYCGYCLFCCSACTVVTCNFCQDDQCAAPNQDPNVAKLDLGGAAASGVAGNCSVAGPKPRAVQIVSVDRLPSRT